MQEIKLNKFSNKRKNIIKKINNSVIVENKEILRKLVVESFNNLNAKKDIYMGIIPKEVVINIKTKIKQIKKNNIGKILNENIEYALKINQDEIRHINKKETITIEDVIDFVCSLDDVIVNFDNVSYGKYNNQNALRFEKNMNDGNHISFNVISNQKSTIRIQTLFLDKKDYKKRSILSTLDK